MTAGRVLVGLAVLAVAAASPPAGAQQGGAGDICDCDAERFAFNLADTDGDGRISEAEMTTDAAAGFAGLDRDGSMTLTPEELGPHDAAWFARVDGDGDGVLTFPEVMRHKLKAWAAGDKDGDGGLTFEEMVEIVRAEEEGKLP
jgi:Ca2+-binding EF-hand superfamily protein